MLIYWYNMENIYHIEKNITKEVEIMKKLGIIIASVILFICIASICYTLTNNLTKNNNSPEENNQENNEQVILLEDNNIKVSYDKVFEEKSIAGVFYLSLLVENLSNKELSLYISDVSINNMTASAGSGMPPKVKAGNSVYAVYFISYNNTDISTLEQLENTNFRLMIMDDNTTSYTDYMDIDIEKGSEEK